MAPEVVAIASAGSAGSDLTAGHDLSLTAQNDIELLAAANTQQLRSSNKSSSASIGVSVIITGVT